MLRPVHILSAVSCGVIATILACDSSQSGKGPSRRDVPPAARHAIESDELRRIMHSLGTEVKRSWPQEIADIKAAEARRDRQTSFKEAKTLADTLGQSAESIPQAISKADLSETERKAFMSQVEQLKTGALDLEASAKRQDYDGMQQVLGRIRATCTGCHEQFAKLAGPIRFGPVGG